MHLGENLRPRGAHHCDAHLLVNGLQTMKDNRKCDRINIANTSFQRDGHCMLVIEPWYV